MSGIEQEKGVVRKNFGIGKFECVKGTDRGKLKHLGREPDFSRSRDNLLYLASQHSADKIFRLRDNSALHGPFASSRRRVFHYRSAIDLAGNRRDIEHEVFTFLIQHRQSVESQCVPKQIDRRVRLLDDAQNRARIRNRERASFGAAAQIAKELFELSGKVLGRVKFLRDRSRREVCQNKARIASAPKSNAFEDVLSQIDADNRICAFRHDAAASCSGKRASRWRFLESDLNPSSRNFRNALIFKPQPLPDTRKTRAL